MDVRLSIVTLLFMSILVPSICHGRTNDDKYVDDSSVNYISIDDAVAPSLNSECLITPSLMSECLIAKCDIHSHSCCRFSRR